MLKSYTGLRF